MLSSSPSALDELWIALGNPETEWRLPTLLCIQARKWGGVCLVTFDCFQTAGQGWICNRYGSMTLHAWPWKTGVTRRWMIRLMVGKLSAYFDSAVHHECLSRTVALVGNFMKISGTWSWKCLGEFIFTTAVPLDLCSEEMRTIESACTASRQA